MLQSPLREASPYLELVTFSSICINGQNSRHRQNSFFYIKVHLKGGDGREGIALVQLFVVVKTSCMYIK